MNETTLACVVCNAPATQFFDGHMAYPVCGDHKCEQALIDEINLKLNDAAAEAAKE